MHVIISWAKLCCVVPSPRLRFVINKEGFLSFQRVVNNSMTNWREVPAKTTIADLRVWPAALFWLFLTENWGWRYLKLTGSFLSIQRHIWTRTLGSVAGDIFLGEKSRNIFTFRFFVKGKCKAKIMPFFGSIVVIKRSGADGSSFPLINEVR